MKTPRRRPILTIIAAVLAVSLVAAAIYFALPPNTSDIVSSPHPAQDYTDAVARVQAWPEPGKMHPLCGTRLLTHGQKVQRAIVFVHGYTNCSVQFAQLGQQFYDLGYNVLMVSLPYHGLADRLTGEQAKLTANDLAAYGDQVVDIAQGLGENVTVAGISMGGAVVAWVAQTRSDVDLAVAIAPAFSFQMIPTPLTAPVGHYLLLAPNSFAWWDETLKEKLIPDYVYSWHASRTLGQLVRLGFAVQDRQSRTPPAAKRILIITNAADTSVNGELIQKVAQGWRTQGAAVETYEYPAALKLEHDLIDPNLPKQNIAAVYPKLIELIAGQP